MQRFLSSQSSAAGASQPTQLDSQVDPWSPLSYSDVARIGTDPEFVDEMTPEEAKLLVGSSSSLCACVCVCVRACVRACVCTYVLLLSMQLCPFAAKGDCPFAEE